MQRRDRMKATRTQRRGKMATKRTLSMVIVEEITTRFLKIRRLCGSGMGERQ